MAFGVDSAAHSGALAGSGPTIAVLAGGADRPYPASKRTLHGQIARTGAVISELPAGTPARRWMFPARNRIIAALAEMTVVVEAREQSGALLTAQFASALGRPLGAVPGPISSPLASGPNGLLAGGARIVRGPQDVLDALFGAGVRSAGERRPAPAPELRGLLAALAEGYGSDAAVRQAGYTEQEGLAALAALELSGHVHREAGGRYAVLP
jgi:DNA processing protein